MRKMSSLWFALIPVIAFLTIPRGVTSQCGLILSRSNQSLAVRVGSYHEIVCRISPSCDLGNQRLYGPFWKKPNGSWFVPNFRVYDLRVNKTANSLRFYPVMTETLGVYVCVARVGRKTYRMAANVTEEQVNQGDVNVTLAPESSTQRPQKRRKRRAIIGIGHRQAAKLLRNAGIVQTSIAWGDVAITLAPETYSPEPSKRSRRSANIRIGLEQAANLMRNGGMVRRSLQGKKESPPENGLDAGGDDALRPVKTPCEEDKLFSKTGIIIVAALTCASFLLLYMVILLMAVPRICFPYYPKTKTNADEQSSDTDKSKERSSTGVAIPLSHKGRHNGRSDSGIESVDGLEERGLHHGGGRNGSPWEIGSDKLEEFYRRTANQDTGSDEDMLSGLKVYNMEKNMPRRGRSESVPVTPYRYQSSIYVKV